MAFTQRMLSGQALLWGDTIQGNIRRYFERYFKPELRRVGLTEGRDWKFRQQDLILEVGPGYTDFRSADKPERWEGFGYDLIFLNEAGIILDNPYLYYNAVLPMLLDNPKSVLIAAGTPKLSRGMGVLFKELWDKVEAGEPGHWGQRFTTRDNPHLDPDAIATLEAQILVGERPQEIDGQFITPENLGSFFQRQWFPVLDETPEIVRAVRGWDFAATEPHEGNMDPDWTVGVLMGITTTGRTVILDVVMARVGPHGVDALLQRTATSDAEEYGSVTHVIPIDPGAAGKTAATHFHDGPLAGHHVVEYPQTRQQGSKATRATPFSIAAGKREIAIAPGKWHGWFFGQLDAFPNPKVHDDAVDGGAAAFNALSEPELFSGILNY